MMQELYQESTPRRISDFLYGVYGIMASGLLATAATAYTVAQSPNFYQILFQKPLIFSLLIIAQFALVIVLSAFINRLSFPIALGLLYAYAVSLGITLAPIFLVYTGASIFTTFLITSGMFAAMAAYGYFTKSDLSTIGNLVTMALVGLIIALLVNLYFQSPAFDTLLSALGVLIFTLLTAYDTQKLKALASQLMIHEQAPVEKVMVLGALTLYLDFVNLFLFLLRFTGTRRED